MNMKELTSFYKINKIKNKKAIKNRGRVRVSAETPD